jgi:primosomal replication protein N
MNNLNSILIEGNLVRDPEFRSTPKGTALCKFSLASNRFFRQDSDLEKEVSFFEAEAWGKLAETCNNQGRKGRGVRVVGRLKQERLNLLEQRKDGTVNRAEMRRKVKELKSAKPASVYPFIPYAERIPVRMRIFANLREIIVRAGSKAEAEEYVGNHCGLVLGGPIHSSLPGEDVDWDFPAHPEKAIGGVRLNRSEYGYP